MYSLRIGSRVCCAVVLKHICHMQLPCQLDSITVATPDAASVLASVCKSPRFPSDLECLKARAVFALCARDGLDLSTFACLCLVVVSKQNSGSPKTADELA